MGVKGKKGQLQRPEVECFIGHFKPMKLVMKIFSCIFYFPVLVLSWISSMLSLLRLVVSTCWALVSTCIPKYYLFGAGLPKFRFCPNTQILGPLDNIFALRNACLLRFSYMAKPVLTTPHGNAVSLDKTVKLTITHKHA